MCDSCMVREQWGSSEAESILRHELFDWKSRHNRSSLLQNIGVVVKDMISHDVPSDSSFKFTSLIYLWEMTLRIPR